MRIRNALTALLTPVVASLLAVAGGSAATAGGWAVTTLDPLPAAPTAGATMAVGFTIRQHGVTPVDFSTWGEVPDVAVVVESTAGPLRFVATAEGTPGHFVADVTFPEAGTFTWSVEQGPFAPQELGTISVAASSERATPASTSSAASEPAWPTSARWLLTLATLVMVGLLGAEIVRGRRPAQPA
jgi:hypothetical protein